LLLASAGFFLITLDILIVNVALTQIDRDLGGGTVGQQWVVDGYTVLFASLLLFAGNMADRTGAKRAFGIGVALFGLTSVACALAPSIGTLIAARAAQGAAAALMLPASMALIREAFPHPARRARALGVWAVGGAVAAALGPLLGGVLTTLDWRWVFGVNVPVCTVMLVLLSRVATSPTRAASFDWAGQVLGVTALVTSCKDSIAPGDLGTGTCLGRGISGRAPAHPLRPRIVDATMMMSRTPDRWLAPAAAWPLALPLVLATVLSAACSVAPDPGAGDTTPGNPGPPGQPAESSSPTTTPFEGTPTPPVAGETPIKITVADTAITARLADNATARDLADQLPLTLTFTDFNQLEKIAKLPRPLSTDGVPAGADPDIGDIGYYAPSGDLVFYYGEVGYFNGIVRIGRFDTTMELIEHQADNFQVRIERA
jgi:MFS family permease